MAYTAKDFERDLAVASLGGIATLQRANIGKFLLYAGKKGISLAALGIGRGAPVAARTAAANPAATGVGLGALALETQMGQDLLAAAAESGRRSRVRAERLEQDLIYGTQEKINRATKRKKNSFSKAVGAGVKAVKASTFQGAKGKLANPKKTFSTVTKVASKVKAGKKVAAKGVTGTISRAVRGILRRR